jgi:hydroxylaminobenzene mutase
MWLAPHVALSAHTLGALQSVLLLALGLVWPRLHLGVMALRIAFWFLLYSSVAILSAYVIASVFGAGNETLPLAASAAHGSPLEEELIRVIAYSSAPTGIVAFGIALWGLRDAVPQARSEQEQQR